MAKRKKWKVKATVVFDWDPDLYFTLELHSPFKNKKEAMNGKKIIPEIVGKIFETNEITFPVKEDDGTTKEVSVKVNECFSLGEVEVLEDI